MFKSFLRSRYSAKFRVKRVVDYFYARMDKYYEGLPEKSKRTHKGCDKNTLKKCVIFHLISEMTAELVKEFVGEFFSLSADIIKDELFILAGLEIGELEDIDDCKLPQPISHKRVTWLVAGGPGSGKSRLVNYIAKTFIKSQFVCKINADDYKKILEYGPSDKQSTDGISRAVLIELTHIESSIVANRVVEHVLSQVETYDRGPHVLLDVVTPVLDGSGTERTDAREKIAHVGGTSYNLFIAACDTVKAVERAYVRWKTTGRPVPLIQILKGHHDVSAVLPQCFGSKKGFTYIYDTQSSSYAELPIIARSQHSTSSVHVFHATKLIYLLMKAELNVRATNRKMLYTRDDKNIGETEKDSDANTITWQAEWTARIAERSGLLMKLVEQGVNISFSNINVFSGDANHPEPVFCNFRERARLSCD